VSTLTPYSLITTTIHNNIHNITTTTTATTPTGTGPDTHYKVLQVVAAGLKVAQSRGDLKGEKGPMVWGYRNVWFVFAPWECNVMIPASEEDLDLMHETFMSCFSTQKEASFPSPMYDGPFSAWAKHLQVEQKKELEDLLGKQYVIYIYLCVCVCVCVCASLCISFTLS
jgi:glucosamine-6-phosphate deaminase